MIKEFNFQKTMNNVKTFSRPEFGEVRTGEGREQMTSLQIAKITGKQHKDVLEAIRNMEPAWVKVNGRKFPLVEYKDAKGEMRPMYQLNKTECLYIATKFNDEARAKLIIRWEELEREKMYGGFKIPQTYSEALKLAATQSEEIEQQRKTLVLQAPKVLFASAVETSHSSCLVGELAKILCQNGVEIGQNRLFEWLRDNNYLCTKGESHNIPTQRAMEQGLFEIKKRTINNPDGSSIVKSTPKVTGKGLIYFVNKFLGKE